MQDSRGGLPARSYAVFAVRHQIIESAGAYNELKHVACEWATWKEIWRRKIKPN